jgi:hypothetical protein
MALQPDVSDEHPPSADRLPTLTEVVQLGGPEAAPAPVKEAAASVMTVEPAAPQPEPEPPPQLDTDALVTEVLHELAPRIDMLLQARLREALAPALARAADGLIRDAREGLAMTLRELVGEAVARALKRRSDR